MDLLIQVKDNDAPFLVELLNKFDFVKVKQTKESEFTDNLETSITQMQSMRKGKIRKPSISELFATNE